MTSEEYFNYKTLPLCAQTLKAVSDNKSSFLGCEEFNECRGADSEIIVRSFNEIQERTTFIWHFVENEGNGFR